MEKILPLRLKHMALSAHEWKAISENVNYNQIIADTIFKNESEIKADFFHSRDTAIRIKRNHAIELTLSLLRKGILVLFNDEKFSESVIAMISPPLYDKYYRYPHQKIAMETEMNKLIAEFMGGIDSGETNMNGLPIYNFPDPVPTERNCEGWRNKAKTGWLYYHNSWEWLKPVVDKIDRNEKGINIDYVREVIDLPISSPIEVVYKAVVNFITKTKSVNP